LSLPGRRSAWAVFHWVYVDGTSMAVCERHTDQARKAGGYGWPLASIVGLEVVAPKVNASAAKLSRPQMLLDVVRGELHAMVRKEVARLQVHVHWSDE
jgi:hypothetical protein